VPGKGASFYQEEETKKEFYLFFFFFVILVSITLGCDRFRDIRPPLGDETDQCLYNGPAFYRRALLAPSAHSSVIQIGLDRELEAPDGDHHQVNSADEELSSGLG
jgi:hypothetical protein